MLSAVDEVENMYLPFPAGNLYARKTPWEGFFFCSRFEGFRTSDDRRQLSATALSDSLGALF